VCVYVYNLHSRIEASETRVSKELHDKTEQHARDVSTMDDIQTVTECNLVLDHSYNTSFSQTLNICPAFLQHCDRSLSHSFQHLYD
jgi:hypothetical protein